MIFLKWFTVLLCIVIVVSQEISPTTPENGESSYIQDYPWTWVCRERKCTKVDKSKLKADEVGRPLQVCKLNCGDYGSLWPKPTVKTEIGSDVFPFYPNNLKFDKMETPSDRVAELLAAGIEIFKTYLQPASFGVDSTDQTFPLGNSDNQTDPVTKNKVLVNIAVVHPFEKVTLTTDESYFLSILKQDDGTTLLVTIHANTYFGARHALETLSQLVAYDEVLNVLQMVDGALVQDKPFFKYRGVLLDTSRNYFTIPQIRKLINGMSFNKLNMFHWHITDTQSFPFYSKRVPQLTKYGAYTNRKIYTPDDIQQLIEYATIRGVKIVAEFDAPAHVGNGWQWGPAARKGELAVCVNKEPWSKFCVEPPCGQLNPANENMYGVLGELYQDMLDVFDNDIFHMGGDEVNVNCWNSSSDITQYLANRGKDLSQESFLDLWGEFQSRALKMLKERSSDDKMSAVMWTSDLTSKEHIKKYLDKKDYIIQIWSEGTHPTIPYIIKEGYRVIFSNYDAWYFDCGYGAWVGGGPSNWCPPYKGWQQVYQNSPVFIYKNATSERATADAVKRGLILGGEAAMWTEQTDGESVENKIWPRAAALAERLWSNPETNWSAAEWRMVTHRQRLNARDLSPDRLQPEWCSQNEGLCYL